MARRRIQTLALALGLFRKHTNKLIFGYFRHFSNQLKVSQQMAALWLLFLSIASSFARPFDGHALLSLGVTSDVAEQGTAWALLSLLAPETNFGDKLQVKFQRVMQETAAVRKDDFVGLYFRADPHVNDPWNWELVNATMESGMVVMDANKAGDMEVRLVRPPNDILARVPLSIHAPCSQICYRHGSCVKVS
jgi:hypothetical protein